MTSTLLETTTCIHGSKLPCGCIEMLLEDITTGEQTITVVPSHTILMEIHTCDVHGF